MKIAQINLPKLDNNGDSLTWDHSWLQDAILLAFGGYTMSEAQGAWRDPEDDKVYKESVICYHVAMDDDATAQERLRIIAQDVARRAKQICVFVVHTSGAVEFVYPVAKEA